MIPFEEERSLTPSEEHAKQILESNWDYVVRATSGIRKDLEERYPQLSELVSQKINEDVEGAESTVFRTGVPDLFAFDESGEYKFVEVKDGEDGLRHTQLRWLRDFEGITAEIWFVKNEKVEEELDADNVQAYTFQDRKGESSEDKIVDEGNGKYLVELPKTLASILGLSVEDSVKWRLKSSDELILDIR